jgi:hypothetical protein
MPLNARPNQHLHFMLNILYEINIDIHIFKNKKLSIFDNTINPTYYILLKLTNDILILVPYKYIIEL